MSIQITKWVGLNKGGDRKVLFYMTRSDITEDLVYKAALKALRQMRSEGINVDALTNYQIMQLLNFYVYKRTPPLAIQAIIDAAQNNKAASHQE